VGVSPAPYPWCHEIELLLACARPRMDDIHVDRAARAASRGIDGARLADLARVHGLSPLLHLHAGRGRVVLPPDAREAGALRASAAAGRGLRLSSELLDVLRVFGDARIDAVPLKGPVLAMAVYGSVALREFGDLDVLVAGRDLARAAACLRERGYTAASPMPGDLPALVERRLHHVTLRSPAGHTAIELHAALLSTLSGRRYDLDVIAPHLEDSTFMGAGVRVLSPSATFAYLTQHGGLHSWSRLEWLATMAAMRPVAERRPETAEAIDALDGRRRAIAALDLASTLIDGASGVSRTTMGRVDRAVLAANRAAVARLVLEPGRSKATSREEFVYQVRTDSGPLLRIRRIWTALAAPQARDLGVLPLPRVLSPLLFALRPVRLAWRWVRRPRGRA
jgi:hypothetical protein